MGTGETRESRAAARELVEAVRGVVAGTVRGLPVMDLRNEVEALRRDDGVLREDLGALTNRVGVLESRPTESAEESDQGRAVERLRLEVAKLKESSKRWSEWQTFAYWLAGALDTQGAIAGARQYRDGETVAQALRRLATPDAVDHDGGGVACERCGYTWHTTAQAAACGESCRPEGGAS